MPLNKKLVNYLTTNKVKYEVVEHRKVFTAHDAAETQHVKPQEVVKTLVMKLDNNYAFALIPANKNLDKNKLKKLINTHRKKSANSVVKQSAESAESAISAVNFAKEPWMKKNLLGKVGATPPFGKLLKLPVYIDSALTKTKKLIVNSGEYTESLILSTSQYLKLEAPVKGSFSQAKK